jgi:WhiB family transcriptional regulator, redox-sensing transcriptional regulator
MASTSPSDAEVLRLLDQGLRVPTVALRSGLTREAVRDIGRRNGRSYDAHEKRMHFPGAQAVRPPRLHDIAARAGVSVSTASRVINGGSCPPGAQVTARVLQAAAELRRGAGPRRPVITPPPPRRPEPPLPVRAAGGGSLPCASAPDLFFAEAPKAVMAARRLCQGCPERRACLAGAIQRGEPSGVWGGELFGHGQIVVPLAAPPPPPPAPRSPSRSLPPAAAETARRNLRAAARPAVEAAAARACEQVRRALAVLTLDDISSAQAEAARLRLDHPKASVPELAEMAWPKVSRHAMASRIRTLLKVAERHTRTEGAAA